MNQPKKDLATKEGQDALMAYLSRCLDVIAGELPAELQPMILLIHRDDPECCTAVGHPTRAAAIGALQFLESSGTELLANGSGVLVSADDEPVEGESVQ